ncbi:MAG: HAMP domain-containing sensor histidine kinase [Spirochaetota bacterium]
MVFIKGNSIQLIQILENLIKNSIDAAEVPYIIIKTGNEPRPYITIKDNGNGISFCFKCKSKNCLNCKEFQIGKTTKEEGSGTGMVYVQNTLKQMNANLSIESNPGEGTSVTITLPDSTTKKLERIEQIYLDKQNGEIEAFKGV